MTYLKGWEKMSENIEEMLAKILNLCESDPDAGLKFIERVMKESPQSGNDPFGRFAKAIAYGAKGLFHLVRNKSEISLIDLNERQMRETLGITDQHLDYLEKGLNEIREMERTRPGALKLFGKQAELKVDAMALVLERCRPGRVYELLGKTKLVYFGPERIFRRNECEITREEFNIFIDIFFTCDETPRSALISRDGIDSKGRRYVTVALYTEPTIFNELGEQSPVAGCVCLYIDGTYTQGVLPHNDE